MTHFIVFCLGLYLILSNRMAVGLAICTLACCI